MAENADGSMRKLLVSDDLQLGVICSSSSWLLMMGSGCTSLVARWKLFRVSPLKVNSVSDDEG